VEKKPAEQLISQTTSEKALPIKPFRNRLDHPITAREIEQLKLKNLREDKTKPTNDILSKLLVASEQTGKELTRYLKSLEKGKQKEGEKEYIKIPQDTKEREEQFKKIIRDFSADL